MNQYKICVYAICKNEEGFVDRWMDAVREADLVVVTDTGSVDHTVERLLARGAVVYRERIDPWRFDAARNAAMDHIPEDVDLCVSNDLDEVFEPGWRKRLEDAWAPGYTRARYMFQSSGNEDDKPSKQFMMEKIHLRHGFRWVHPVHEVLRYKEPDKEKYVWVNGLVLHHRPDPSKPRAQYLPLLELSAAENPEDDRTAFWLGREYLYQSRFEESIKALKRHLALKSAVWDEERCASMRLIARCYQEKGDLRQARTWLYRAVAECPHVREPYLQMAKLGYRENDWPLVFYMTQKALEIQNKTDSYLLEPEAWGYSLYDLGAICCYRLGLYEKSFTYARIALEMAPENERLKTNLQRIAQKLGEQSRGEFHEAFI